MKHAGYVTDIIGDLSIEWLKNRDKSKPFMLMSQHKAPHREWAPAPRHLGWDNDRRHPEPETLFDDFADRSKAIRDHDMGLDRTFTDLDAKFRPAPNMTEEQLEAWNAYYKPRNEAFRKANLTGRDLVRWRYNRYMHEVKETGDPPRSAYGNRPFEGEPQPQQPAPGKKAKKKA